MARPGGRSRGRVIPSSRDPSFARLDQVDPPLIEASIMTSSHDDVGLQSVDALFAPHMERLRRTVRLRLDRRLWGIVDSSAVLRLARDEVARRSVAEAGAFADQTFLRLRQVVGQVLARLHEEHLGPDAAGDISLYRGALPEATSVSLAAQLLGRGGDDREAARAGRTLLLQETLNAMDPIDREVLTLRHCERLSNDEAAAVLVIPRAQASEAYLRALKRIAPILASLPGLPGGP
jgi:DNA-directed RNA polymerase specialized sigma24 family protein